MRPFPNAYIPYVSLLFKGFYKKPDDKSDVFSLIVGR
jgi:hypothetical protein